MKTETKNKRRHLGGTMEQPVGFVHGEGAAVFEVTVEPLPVGLHADGVRYGPMGLVALEVVGVPVRRGLVIDDELSLLWRREARLMEVKAELAAAREWGLVQLLRLRLAKVDVRQEELWRRWREMRGAESICKSLVVVGEGRVA